MNETVYIFAQIEVKDHKTYMKEYAAPFAKLLEKYDVKVLAASREYEMLEGEEYGNWVVLMEFPNKTAALNFSNSEDYKPLAKRRVEELTTGGKVILFSSKP